MTPDYRETTQKLVDGYAIGAWPEFIALFKYLGLTNQQLRVCGIELEVSLENVIVRTIDHKYEKEYLPLINLPKGMELFGTKEFRAFRERLSIPYYLDEKRITIRICEGEQPVVIQEYAPREKIIKQEEDTPVVVEG